MNVTIIPSPDSAPAIWRNGKRIGTLGPRVQPDKDMARRAISLRVPDLPVGSVHQLTGTILAVRRAKEVEFYTIKS